MKFPSQGWDEETEALKGRQASQKCCAVPRQVVVQVQTQQGVSPQYKVTLGVSPHELC